jgi:16S rRNA (guanine1516-N2)-methyltransferase
METIHPPAVAVAVAPEAFSREREAAELARRLGLPLAFPHDAAWSHLLVFTVERLELRRTGSGAPGPLFVDFVSGAAGYRRRQQEGRRQPLAKAAGLKAGYRPAVFDATAGLGRDAFVLASLGCPVRMSERSPIVAALLADGLARAAAHQETGEIAARMALLAGDSLRLLRELGSEERPQVVYLDPMFPPRHKSGLVKKEMRLLREVAGEDPDAAPLLTAALHAATVRVVVKRPRLAPALDGPAPTTAIIGKSNRYDIYLTGGKG